MKKRRYELNFQQVNNFSLARKLKIMLLIIIFIFSSNDGMLSQHPMLSLKLKNVEVEDVIKEIGKQSELTFLYRSDLLKGQTLPEVDVENQPLDNVLNELLISQGLEYETIDNTVVIRKAPQTAPAAVEQQTSVTGTITDAGTGESLPGVNIIVTGTGKGTITGADGNYSIEAPSNATLDFSFVGYKKITVPVENRQVINVSMEKEIMALEEVVTIGYGQMQRANLTGAVATVRSDDLEKPDAPNIETLIQGRMPGVYTTSGTGLPGKPNTDILIRGLGTMNNSSPLVLIDGVEASMDNLNPYDIESISVLKDAASAAIYGNKAANGVILITTKRGETGVPKLTYNVSMGVQKPVRYLQKLDSWQVATMENEKNINSGLNPIWTDQEIQTFKDQSDPWNYPNTDWMDLLMQGSGFTQNHNLAISGGTDMSRYRLSVGYFNQEGIVKYTDYKRYNIRFNLDSKLSERFKLFLTTSLSQGITDEPMTPPFNTTLTQIFRQVNRVAPYRLNKTQDGEWVWATNDGNPIAWIEEGGSILAKDSRVLGNLGGEYTIVKNLTLSGNIEANYYLSDSKSDINTVGPYATAPEQGPSSVTDNISRGNTITMESQLRYENNFGVHGIKAMLGVSRQSYEYASNSAYRQNLPADGLNQVSAGSADGQTASGSGGDDNIGSYYGRINYSYEDRYLLEANLRRDGSSKFAADYRWGNFPSFSAGWRISEESFLENITSIDNLKLRVSWGKLGNNRISSYVYIPNITLGRDYPIGSSMVSGAAQTSAAVEDITWETTTQMDIGVDVAVMENLLYASLDYYDRYTDDILINIPVTEFFGLPAPTINAGAMTNSGIEIQLGHMNNVGDFRYDVGGQVSFNKNEVDTYPYPAISYSNFMGDRIQKEGNPWNAYYGYEVEGIFKTDAEAAGAPSITGSQIGAGDYKFKDQNGDGVIDEDDRVVIGNFIPEITYGFNMNFAYKNFDLSLFWQGAAKVSRYMGSQTRPLEDANTALKMHWDRTIVENGQVVQEGRYPKLGGYADNYAFNDRFLFYNASYLRLKSVKFGYTLPLEITRILKISGLRIYFSGNNLLTFTDSEFPESFDPEVFGYSGRANGVYPQVAFYNFGLDVNF
ncbi:TonB-dependent receptor [Bacteroidota bacterium]